MFLVSHASTHHGLSGLLFSQHGILAGTVSLTSSSEEIQRLTQQAHTSSQSLTKELQAINRIWLHQIDVVINRTVFINRSIFLYCWLIAHSHSCVYKHFVCTDTLRLPARHRVQQREACSREHPRHDELPDGHQQHDWYRKDDARNLRHQTTAQG